MWLDDGCFVHHHHHQRRERERVSVSGFITAAVSEFGVGPRQRERQLGGNGPIDERATVVEFSLANFNIILDTSNLNYPGIHVHVASNSHLGGLLGHDGLQMTSEVKADLKTELSDLNYECFHASLAC